MAHHQRLISTATAPGAHPITLKVLRLSRPSLAAQTPLPPTEFGDGLDIPPEASLAYSSTGLNSTFPLTPLLTLPPVFGAAYVGETFTCTLCANNEIKEGDNKTISSVRITVELQTPGGEKPVKLELADADGEGESGDIQPGGTMQKTLTHELKEEGQHVLAVTVTYTETFLGSGGGASGGRLRTFRKLYQFVAQPLIAVRSKITERKTQGKNDRRQWLLEAQIENVGEASVVLENLNLNEREGITGVSLNGTGGKDSTVLKPQDVEQIMFLLREKVKPAEDAAGRVPLGQLSIEWRSAMGERGSLKTGWLASRGR